MSTTAQKPTPQTVEATADSDLPEGWTSATIGEVTETVPNLKPEATPNRLFGYVDISSICNQTYRITDVKRFKGKDAPSRARRPIRPGDVLFSNVRTYLRNIALVPDNVEAQLCSTGFTVLRSNGVVEPDLLFYQVVTDRFIDLVTPQQTGSQYPATSDRVVMSTEISVPPLPEQKRIDVKIGSLLLGVNAARNRLGKIPLLLKRFRQAVLAAACSGRLTEDWREKHPDVESGNACLKRVCGSAAPGGAPNGEDPIELPDIPETWAWSTCEPLCDPKRDVTYGVIKLGAPLESGVPTLRSSDVRWLYLDPEDVKRISPEIAAEYSRTFLQGGELLITIRGTLGGIALVPKSMAGFNISREVAMVPLRSEFDAQFFCYAVASIWSQNWLSEVTKGVAYTGINIRDLKRLPLVVPPIAEQREIVRRVEALFKLADMIEKRVEGATRRTDKLTQAILAKAFRGELVPTEAELARREGRSYEPASALLARIRAERAAKASRDPSERRSLSK